MWKMAFYTKKIQIFNLNPCTKQCVKDPKRCAKSVFTKPFGERSMKPTNTCNDSNSTARKQISINRGFSFKVRQVKASANAWMEESEERSNGRKKILSSRFAFSRAAAIAASAAVCLRLAMMTVAPCIRYYKYFDRSKRMSSSIIHPNVHIHVCIQKNTQSSTCTKIATAIIQYLDIYLFFYKMQITV